MGQSRTGLTLWFAVVAAVWLGARVAYFNGYYTEDAPGYVGDAIAIAVGDYHARHDVNGLNVGTYAPVAVALAAMGKSEVALSLWPLFCSLLGTLSMAGSATLLYGRVFGAVAAFLYATYPGDVFFSTVVMPDSIQAGWLSFSLFLVIWGCTGRFEYVSRRLAAAGAAMGVCHLIRANGAILLPVGLAAAAILSFNLKDDVGVHPGRQRLVEVLSQRCGVFVAGWVCVLVLEAVIYWWVVGDFFFRFHVVSGHYGSSGSISQWGLNTNRLTIPYSAFAPLLWRDLGGWGSLNQDQAYHGLLFTWALMALLLGTGILVVAPRQAPRHARAGLMVAAVWFAWPLLYHQFGSQSLTEFIPIHRLSRHLVVHAPGAILAAVGGCSVIWAAGRTGVARAALGSIALAVVLVHLQFNLRGEAIAYKAYHDIKDTYIRIRDRLPGDTRVIVADPGDLGFFDFWLNPLGESRVALHALAAYPNCRSLRTGVVLTQSNPGWHLGAPVIRETVARLPCLLNPPAEWRLLYTGHPERVYVID